MYQTIHTDHEAGSPNHVRSFFPLKARDCRQLFGFYLVPCFWAAWVGINRNAHLQL